jgi:hypothetical protein
MGSGDAVGTLAGGVVQDAMIKTDKIRQNFKGDHPDA